MSAPPLLRELRAILADYVDRVGYHGGERFRLPGETPADWERKQHRIRACLATLTETVEADDRGRLDELLREVAKAPDAPVPSGLLDRLVEADTAALRARVAALHRAHPERCPGEGCPCR